MTPNFATCPAPTVTKTLKQVMSKYGNIIISPYKVKMHIIYVTGFWKISFNVTFYSSNIYNQNEEWELPINLKVVTMCGSYLKLPENKWKYF